MKNGVPTLPPNHSWQGPSHCLHDPVTVHLLTSYINYTPIRLTKTPQPSLPVHTPTPVLLQFVPPSRGVGWSGPIPLQLRDTSNVHM